MTKTSAGGQMADYLWQAVEACRRALTVPHDVVVKIEVEDDLSVATMEGAIISCEQLKHSENDKAISENSPIWWQAIDALILLRKVGDRVKLIFFKHNPDLIEPHSEKALTISEYMPK